MTTLLNLSGKIDPRIIADFESVSCLLNEMEIPYVVVGATARDLVLYHGHGAELQRATSDIDFAIEIPNWLAFESIKERLCEQGFSATQTVHRLMSPRNTVVDLVPFGVLDYVHKLHLNGST